MRNMVCQSQSVVIIEGKNYVFILKAFRYVSRANSSLSRPAHESYGSLMLVIKPHNQALIRPWAMDQTFLLQLSPQLDDIPALIV